MYYTEQTTYYNIQTKDFEDYAMDKEELAEIIAMHAKDQAIYCVQSFTETIERELEDPLDHPSLTPYERNR